MFRKVRFNEMEIRMERRYRAETGDGVVGILTVGDVEQRARGGRVRQVGEDVAAAVGGARQRRLQRQRAQQRRAQLGAQPARAARRGGEHLAAALPRTHNAFTALRGDPS